MNPLSTLLLYRFHHGELEGAERERVRAAIESDPTTRTRYQEILASEAEFAVMPLPSSVVALDPAPRRWWAVAVSFGGLVAVAAAILLVVAPGGASMDSGIGPSEDVVRTKGEIPELEVWFGAPEGARLLREHELVGEGDRIQLSFHPKGRRLVSFAGQDGLGEIEVYGTVEADPGQGLQPAPFALELDDAPGPQTFFLLGHDTALSDEELARAFRSRSGDLRMVVLPKRQP